MMAGSEMSTVGVCPDPEPTQRKPSLLVILSLGLGLFLLFVYYPLYPGLILLLVGCRV
jgi:hypothetical protein